MSNIDKDWLQQKIADMEAARDEIPFGLDEDDSNTLAAMKLVLASLESEAVAFVMADDLKDSSIISTPAYRDLGEAMERTVGDVVALYAAPPSPVSVPECTNEQCMEFLSIAFRHAEIKGDLELDDIRQGVKIVNGSRAAMLQGADTELQRKAAIHDALCENYNIESLSDFVDWQRNHIAELEAAPPAPVGKGETAVMPDYTGYALTQRECYQAGKMAGLAEAGNSPVIPDGWALVPIEPTEDMIVNGFESEPDESFSDEKEWEAYDAMSGCQQAAHRARLCWSAMIASRPKLKHDLT